MSDTQRLTLDGGDHWHVAYVPAGTPPDPRDPVTIDLHGDYAAVRLREALSALEALTVGLATGRTACPNCGCRDDCACDCHVPSDYEALEERVDELEAALAKSPKS